MAQDATIYREREAEDFVRLTEGDKIAFVRPTDGNGVFKFGGNSKQNNGYVAVIIRDGEPAYPFELSMSSITAPYGVEPPYKKQGVNKLFYSAVKRAYSQFVESGQVIEVKESTTVQFTSKKGPSPWTCYLFEKVDEFYTLSPENQKLVDEFATEHHAYKIERLKKAQQ
jgi:hypothetical protein